MNGCDPINWIFSFAQTFFAWQKRTTKIWQSMSTKFIHANVTKKYRDRQSESIKWAKIPCHRPLINNVSVVHTHYTYTVACTIIHLAVCYWTQNNLIALNWIKSPILLSNVYVIDGSDVQHSATFKSSRIFMFWPCTGDCSHPAINISHFSDFHFDSNIKMKCTPIERPHAYHIHKQTNQHVQFYRTYIYVYDSTPHTADYLENV